MTRRQEIYLDYDQAIKQAERLEEIARSIERLASDRMESAAATLKAAWQSDSSPAYIQKMGIVRDEIKSSAKSIKRVAQSIRDNAEEIRKAELRALRIAEARSYK